MCDLDIPVPVNDGRRLEVVVDGLPLFGGAQLALDTTLVSSLHCDGSPHRGAADVDGAVLVAARRRKERTYPELVRPGHRAKLGGVLHQTSGKSLGASRTSLGNEMVLLACVCGSAVSVASLLERRAAGGADGETPTVHHVVNDWRFASLDLAV